MLRIAGALQSRVELGDRGDAVAFGQRDQRLADELIESVAHATPAGSGESGAF
jgi:hypothetical protein